MEKKDEKKTELTKCELEIMQIIWEKDNVFLADIMEAIPEPRPAYTTVSTIIRVLVRKGFVSYKAYSKSHCYFAAITKEEYSFRLMKSLKRSFFGNSTSSMISFFTKKEELSQKEKDELIELLNE